MGIVLFFFLLAAGVARFCQAWITKEEEERFTAKIAEVWIRFDEAGMLAVVRFPLRLLSLVYDAVSGKNVISGKAIFRSSIVSLGILAMTISTQAILSIDVVNFWNAPFLYSSEQFDGLKRALENQETAVATVKNEQAKKTLIEIQKEREKLLRFNTPFWKYLYTSVFLILLLLTTSLLFSASVAITRLMLKEILDVPTIILMLCVLALNIFVVILISSFVMLTLTILSFPISIPLITRSISLVVTTPPIALLVYFVSYGLLRYFGSCIFKGIAIIVVMPALSLLFFTCISIMLYPVRGPVYKFLNRALLRAAEHEKGAIFFFSAFFGGLVSIITALLSRFIG